MEKGVNTLIELYDSIYDKPVTIANLDELALELSQVAGRSKPWTGKFLHSLIKGYAGFTINDELLKALKILTSQQNGTDALHAQLQQATVLTLNPLPEGTIILGDPQRCATPGCDIIFVPTHPRQKYHDKNCAAQARRLIKS